MATQSRIINLEDFEPTRYNIVDPSFGVMPSFEPGKHSKVNPDVFEQSQRFILKLRAMALDSLQTVNNRLDWASLFALNIIVMLARLVRYFIA